MRTRTTVRSVLSFASLGAALTLGTPGVRADDWYIGLSNPTEVVTLTTDKTVTGSVYVFNSARLNLRSGARLTVGREVGAFNSATIDVQGSTVHFPQPFAYRSQFTCADSAQLLLTGATIDGNSRSFGVGLAGSAHAEFQGVTVVNGFATWALFDQASANITGGVNTGEFVPFGNTALSIVSSQGVILWLTLFSGSVVDVSLPAPGSVPAFTIGPGVPWASGIPYTATLTNCTDVNFAVMARSGSSGTWRNSTLRVVGSYWETSDVVGISGLASNAYFADSSFAWGSIDHRFINTSVRTWNHYATGSTNLTLSTCIAGEVWAQEQAVVTMAASMCDGSGGYINVGGNAVLYMLSSTNLSQTTLGGQGVLIAGQSAFLGQDFDANENSLVALVNSQTWADPRAHDGATVLDASVEPLTASVGDLAPVRGSARIIKGPQSPVLFNHYDIAFADPANPGQWTPIGGPGTAPVQDGTLAVWNTRPLHAGTYPVRLSVYTNFGDPIETIANAALSPGCAADLNRDGFVDGLDYDVFNNAFETGNPFADFNADGFVDGLDSDGFNNAFAGGC